MTCEYCKHTTSSFCNHCLLDEFKTPPHYDYKIQPVDFIEANNLGFCVGNVIKYICRYDKKGTPMEDLEKAIHYIEILKSKLKK